MKNSQGTLYLAATLNDWQPTHVYTCTATSLGCLFEFNPYTGVINSAFGLTHDWRNELCFSEYVDWGLTSYRIVITRSCGTYFKRTGCEYSLLIFDVLMRTTF